LPYLGETFRQQPPATRSHRGRAEIARSQPRTRTSPPGQPSLSELPDSGAAFPAWPLLLKYAFRCEGGRAPTGRGACRTRSAAGP
jgi:hypothetical protein